MVDDNYSIECLREESTVMMENVTNSFGSLENADQVLAEFGKFCINLLNFPIIRNASTFWEYFGNIG